MAAAPAGAAVQVAAAPTQGFNRGDGGWCRQAAVTLAQCSGDASLVGAWLEEAQGSNVQAGQNQGSATREPGFG